MVFPVLIYRSESWTIKKTECWRIFAFELWYWQILLRVPWTERRSNQSMLKEINPEHSLEELMLKLSWWCEEMTHWKRPWCWDRLKAGGEGENRLWDGWMASPTRWTWVWASSGSWWWTGRPGVLQSMESQRVRHSWVTDMKNTRYKVSVLSVVLALKQKYRPMGQDREPRDKLTHLWVPYFWQRRQEYTMRQKQPLQ